MSSSSISRRCSRAMLPWWARTSSSPASSLRRWASRSARRRLLVNTIVLLVLADQLQDPRVDRGPDARPLLAADDGAAGLLVLRQDLAEARHVLDRDDDLELERLAGAGVDDRDLAAVADPAEEPGDRLERALGRAEADPLEGSGGAPSGAAVARRRSRRSRLSARCAPRFVPAIAWTSSTITCSTPRRISRAWLVSRRYRLSGVVTRMSGGWRTRSRRSSAGVSPVRLAIEIRGGSLAEALRGERDARRAGRGGCAPRRRSSALSGRDVERADGARVAALSAAGSGSWTRRSRHHRNAASVLPLPVGAWISVLRPAADRRPALGLGLGGGLERRLEPGPHRGPERREGIDGARDHGTASIGTSRPFRTDVLVGRPFARPRPARSCLWRTHWRVDERPPAVRTAPCLAWHRVGACTRRA